MTMTDEELEQMKRAFFTLEKACGVMYELVMKTNKELIALQKRVARLENRNESS